MVKKQKDSNTNSVISKGNHVGGFKGQKNQCFHNETCAEQLSPFGGLLGLIKFIDLVGFEDIFNKLCKGPQWGTKLGDYLMVVGILMLLFIGFNRIWHFIYSIGCQGVRIFSASDNARLKVRPWVEGSLWPCRFSLNNV